MKLIAIVTITRDNQDEVINVFNELKNQTYENWILIVVDDYSKNIDSLKKIDDPRFKLVTYTGKYEFAYGIKFNFAFKAAIPYKPEYIYKIHTDMSFPAKNLITSMAEVLDQNKEIALVGPKIFNGDNVNTWGKGIVKKRMGHEITITESYMLRTNYLTENDRFQDEVFTWFCEESDFFLRVGLNGFKSAQVDEHIIHYGGATSSKFSSIKKYHRTRSTLIFLYKHNKKYTFYQNLRWYLEEIRNDTKDGISYLKRRQFKNFYLNYYNMIKGFFSGILTIVNGSISRL